MAEFDPKAFAKETLDLVRKAGEPRLKDALEDAKETKKLLDGVEKDVAATLEAMKTETSPNRIAALQHDLEKVLPARRQAIISSAVTELSSDVQAFLETALDIALKAAIVAGKAFVAGRI